MRVLNFEQGSLEWLAWRSQIITGTDAPVITGVPCYSTPYQLWMRKQGLMPPVAETEPMRRGKRDEPIARSLFVERYGIEMNPECIESDLYNFIGASLDGISPCGKFMLEIKSNGIKIHEDVRNDTLPLHHIVQMQHCMLASDGKIEKAFYGSYCNGELLVKEVEPDFDWQKDYIEVAKKFWESLLFGEAPPLGDGDYQDKGMDSAWLSLTKLYAIEDDIIAKAEERKAEYRKQLIEQANGHSCKGGGVKLIRKVVKGRIDYEKIPELQGMDLSAYRKPSTQTWSIHIDKK